MQDDTTPQQHIQVPIINVNPNDFIHQLLNENFQLRQANEAKDKVIDELTNSVAMLKELVQQLRDEIAILKGQKPKPKISPSSLEGQKAKKGAADSGNPNGTGKPGQPKGKLRKKKKTLLEIHDKPVIQPTFIPEVAIFKGYKLYTVQDIIFKPHNTQYQIAQWMLPDGSYLTGELPKGTHGHYGPELVAYILHQNHTCRVTEPLLLEQLKARGVLISAGQLNNILIKDKDFFHEEVAELLLAGVEADGQVQADDTGGRHRGMNQYTTVIGNKWFSFFATTESKSRINFLKLLQQSKGEYLINADTIEYLQEAGVASYLPGYIALHIGAIFTTKEDWEQFLREQNIISETEIRFVAEAALYASVIEDGIPRDLGVHGDDAGQFNAFVRSLCWIHEERHYRKLIMTTEQARADLERVRDQIWSIYQKLKAFKASPEAETIESIKTQFDDIFRQETSSPTLNHQLKKTYQKKEELLRVLQRPETPLHNNASETDARSAKTKLKVSGGTRSDMGRDARDTFLSLKQTCMKLGINFIAFLQDRVCGLYTIPRLAEIIRQRSLVVTDQPS